ncbi:gamma subclass chorismate mutase AroQ, partial [Nonomuraea fuscirosea]
MNLRTRMTRYTMIAGMFGAATIPAAPQAMAAATPTSTVGSAAEAGTSRGKLGPLTDGVIERIRVSDDVAAAKFGTGSPIEDPVREEQVLEQVRKQAVAAELDPDAAVAFFRDQITASKVVQKGLFARWTAHPQEAPTTRPDLGQIRERLDQLTTDLLAELKNTERVRDQPVAPGQRLVLGAVDHVVVDVVVRRRR